MRFGNNAFRNYILIKTDLYPSNGGERKETSGYLGITYSDLVNWCS